MNGRATVLIVVCLVMVFPAQADEWRSKAGSRFGFETTFEGVAMPGDFAKFAVALSFDPARPVDGSLRVTVDLAAADMGDPDMNAVLYEPAWFDTQQFAAALYTSSEIVERSPGQFLAKGTLDLKGIREPVEVPFAWERSGDAAVMTGELTLDRTRFDVGSGEWASGDAIGIEVKLSFTVQLELAR